MKKLLSFACALVLSTLLLHAQPKTPPNEGGHDEVTPPDTTDILDIGEPRIDRSNHFGMPRAGVFVGPTFELTTMQPNTFDPGLDGQFVLYGFQGYIIISGWTFGGVGVSAKLYNQPELFKEVTYGYAGFLTGYDFWLGGKFSSRVSALIGSGGLRILFRRTDLRGRAGNAILEVIRDEGFFCFRPGISVGFTPLDFIDFRASADYMLPFGGASVSDVRNLSFGVHIMVGFGGM
jgi:hypothetical protein